MTVLTSTSPTSMSPNQSQSPKLHNKSVWQASTPKKHLRLAPLPKKSSTCSPKISSLQPRMDPSKAQFKLVPAAATTKQSDRFLRPPTQDDLSPQMGRHTRSRSASLPKGNWRSNDTNWRKHGHRGRRSSFPSSRSPSRSRSPNAPVRSPLGGKLKQRARDFFCQAYGLEGKTRVRHDLIIQHAMSETECSERAIQEVLYGHSYSEELADLREQVPSYPAKVANKLRGAQLQELLQDLAIHEFYRFNGNERRKSA